MNHRCSSRIKAQRLKVYRLKEFCFQEKFHPSFYDSDAKNWASDELYILCTRNDGEKLSTSGSRNARWFRTDLNRNDSNLFNSFTLSHERYSRTPRESKQHDATSRWVNLIHLENLNIWEYELTIGDSTARATLVKIIINLLIVFYTFVSTLLHEQETIIRMYLVSETYVQYINFHSQY